MKKLLSLGIAATACAAFFATAAPAAAKRPEYCRRDITGYTLSCSFDTMAQCQEMSSGRGGDCLRDPTLGSASDAYAYAPIARKPLHK
jgi:Protein of unknown function (DUF3551)